MDNIERVGTRISYCGYNGTVRYSGFLIHDTNGSNVNTKDTWLGIEWDNPYRGHHSGVVKSVEYFKCASNLSAGSLVRFAKVDKSVELIEAYVRKYFKPEEAHNILNHEMSLVEFLMDLSDKYEKLGNGSGVQYDEDALIKTAKAYKRIEFLGFERIWKIITNVKKVSYLSLASMKIGSIGKLGDLGTLFKSLRELSLEGNLLGSWNEVSRIAIELPYLERLWLNGNRLRFQQDITNERFSFAEKFHQSLNAVDEETENNFITFPRLKLAALDNMGLNFKTLNLIAQIFNNVEELVIAENECSDLHNLDIQMGMLEKLKVLDLSQNKISETDGIEKLGAWKLEKLNLSRNSLTEIPFGQFLPHLTHLNVSTNSLGSLSLFKELAEFKSLQSLRMKDNPILVHNSKEHVRLVIIAVCLKLKTLNGSEITRADRRDADIYFLKNTFHEFFTDSRTTQFTYDFDKYLSYATARYPFIEYYLKRMGNPYPVEERFYQETIKPTIKPKVQTTSSQSGGFVSINFFTLENGGEVILVQKKMPKSIDIGYLRAFVRNFLKLRKTPFSLYVVEYGVENLLDNDITKLEELDDNGRISIRVIY